MGCTTIVGMSTERKLTPTQCCCLKSDLKNKRKETAPKKIINTTVCKKKKSPFHGHHQWSERMADVSGVE